MSTLLVADLVGIAVFAASGATASVAKRLDLFGVVFVGCVTALGGGVVRDLLIDAPPSAFHDWWYGAVAVVTAAATFRLHPRVTRLRRTMLVLDAAGLALFTVTGTLKALDAGVPGFGAVVIGMITGIGGGLGRDLLLGGIPVVLTRGEIYAVAGLVGGVAAASMHGLDIARPLLLAVAAVAVFTLRLLAIFRAWSVPLASGERGDG